MNLNSASAVPNLEVMRNLEEKVTNCFKAADYTYIEPAIMQPADVYLQQIGEAVRGRTYVFTAIDGEELCLRPDLTVPAARIFLERYQEEGEKAQYYYSGPAFRYPFDGPAHGNAREFRQAGIENFGRGNTEKAEAETLILTLEALKAVGVNDYKIRFGDLGLFYALLDAIEMPDRWRKRLTENFWRHNEFSSILESLAKRNDEDYERDMRHLLRRINECSSKEAENHVAEFLSERAIPLIGARTLPEITRQLIEQSADLMADPLEPEKVQLINQYLEISAPPKAVGARLQDLAETAGLDISNALNRYQKRIDLLNKAEIDLSNAEFTAEFGRNLEYYTGFVFQIEKSDMGVEGQIAGGGRYDHLLKSLGFEREIPAIGAAIHLDRLAALVDGDVL